MTVYFNKLYESIQSKLKNIDLDGCDISIEEAFSMVEFLKKCLSDLRNFFLSQESVSVQEEIMFFKEMKPEVLGLLLYFNKMHSIELKRPTGSNEITRPNCERENPAFPYDFAAIVLGNDGR